jgi:CHAD domain-containing protein
VTYQLEADRPLSEEVRRVALECLDDAIGRLRRLAENDGDVEQDVHQARKRGKETRGLIRLVRPALGAAYAAINAEVRDGARELSSLRDAHALLGTVEDLASSIDGNGTDELEVVAGHLRVAASAATHGIGGDDPRLAVARSRMETARAMVDTWSAEIEVGTLAGGVAKTAKRGRSAWKAVRKDPTDEEMHVWRKGVKYLWYQARLLEAGDPDGIGALVEQLDDLSDLLGDEHDLTVLVEHLERAAGSEALGDVDVDGLIELARARLSTLRVAAMHLGEQVYGDGVERIVARLVGPWSGAAGSTRPASSSRSMVQRPSSTCSPATSPGWCWWRWSSTPTRPWRRSCRRPGSAPRSAATTATRTPPSPRRGRSSAWMPLPASSRPGSDGSPLGDGDLSSSVEMSQGVRLPVASRMPPHHGGSVRSAADASGVRVTSRWLRRRRAGRNAPGAVRGRHQARPARGLLRRGAQRHVRRQ